MEFPTINTGFNPQPLDPLPPLPRAVPPMAPPPIKPHRQVVPSAVPSARKDDGGKPDTSLLDDMPRALLAVVEVMQWAVTKKAVPYERGSWLGVHADRYRAAIKRHDLAAAQQASNPVAYQPPRFQRDDETKLLHLAHIATSALMALENTLRELEPGYART